MNKEYPVKNPISPEDKELLDKLYDVINGDQRPVLLGREGAHIDFPEPVFHLLVEIVKKMRRGQSVVLLSKNEELTTQAAADQLGVSRPHLVKLLERGEIEFHTVGSHRRVYLNHLIDYAKRRDAERSKRLRELSRKIAEEGFYESEYTGEDES